MISSRTDAFLREILGDEKIPLGKLAFFRERFRDKLYDIVISEFLKEEKRGLTKAAVSRRIGRKPEQITRWLGAPGNWTLETVSDLLLAISGSEPDVSLSKLGKLGHRNYQYGDWMITESSRTNSEQVVKSVTPLGTHKSLGLNGLESAGTQSGTQG